MIKRLEKKEEATSLNLVGDLILLSFLKESRLDFLSRRMLNKGFQVWRNIVRPAAQLTFDLSKDTKAKSLRSCFNFSTQIFSLSGES